MYKGNYKKSHRRYWRVDNQAISIDSTPPTSLTQLQPLDILVTTNNAYHLSIPYHRQRLPTIPATPTTWQEYISRLWERRIINDMQYSAQSIWYHFINSNQEVIIVTDGSYKDHKASYAWLMHDGNKQINTGSGTVTGNPTTAFRSELFGIVAWYCCVHHICQYLQYDIHITISPYTDNKLSLIHI